MKRYEWAPAAPFKGDANEVQAEIERLKKSGGATPATVVACARSKRSVLHPLIFNVDAKEAANRYYLGRATNLLNAIRIVNDEGEITHLRANIRVVDGDDSAYGSIDDRVARGAREEWLLRRLASIRQELDELGLYPQIALAIQEALAA